MANKSKGREGLQRLANAYHYLVAEAFMANRPRAKDASPELESYLLDGADFIGKFANENWAKG